MFSLDRKPRPPSTQPPAPKPESGPSHTPSPANPLSAQWALASPPGALPQRELTQDRQRYFLSPALPRSDASPVVQLKPSPEPRGAPPPAEHTRRLAERGLAGSDTPLPFRQAIEASFGPSHDLSTVRAHQGSTAALACGAIGARAYTQGERIAFGEAPSLLLAAHEAAHVIHQRAGLALPGGVGATGDRHERNADAVAARVAAGMGAADLLAPYALAARSCPSSVGGERPVQRQSAPSPSTADLVRDAVKAGDYRQAFTVLGPLWLLHMFDVCLELDPTGELIQLTLNWAHAGGLGEDRIRAGVYAARVSRQQAGKVDAGELSEARSSLLKIAVDQKDELIRERLSKQKAGSGAEELIDALLPYSKGELKTKLEGKDSPFRILRWLRSLSPPSQREAAIVDLQDLQHDYSTRAQASPSNAGLRTATDKTEFVLFRLYSDLTRAQAPGKAPPAPSGTWAAGSAPPELLAGTHALSPGDITAANNALSPALAGGQPAPTFQDKLPSGALYEWDLRVKVAQWIAQMHTQLVVGKGESEYADPQNLWPMSRFEELAQAAKDETDAVFGSYAVRPAYVAGVNLVDNWKRQNEAIFGVPGPGGTRTGGKSPAARRKQAENLLRYAMSADEALLAVHKAHGALLDRAPEKDIVEKVVQSVAQVEELKLLHIDRGWEAEANPSTAEIFIMPWKRAATPTRSADLNNRAMFWDMFKTLVHEYLHTLAHPDFSTMVQGKYAYGTSQQNTLVEGVDSVLTDVVWSRILGRVSALRPIVEKPFAAQPLDWGIIPQLSAVRYPSFAEGMALVRAVGLRNLYAAYFLGRVDLIGQ